MTPVGGHPQQGPAPENGDDRHGVETQFAPVTEPPTETAADDPAVDECSALVEPRWDEGQAVHYLDVLYEGRPGFVVLGFGLPTLSADGSYGYSAFKQAYCRLPQEHARLLQEVQTAVASLRDVFITPLLRDAPSRQQGESAPLPGRYVWLDVDGWTAEVESALRDLGLPGLLVDSGGLGKRRHAYLDVGQRLPGAQVAEYADRLAKVLGTDTAGTARGLHGTGSA